MRTTIAFGLILALGIGAPVRALDAQNPSVVSGAAYDPWTAEEIENLLAPIALYPDPILAQVLIAATYPDQIAAAAAYVRTNGTVGLDQQPWEISVKAVAHYPPVLNLMAEGEDWAVALGQAYAEQPRDVMNGVQSLRRMANAHGNLVSTEQQRVVVEREVIRIEPAQPRVIYVPVYDPAVVYFRPVYVVRAHPAYWAWGMGYPVGAWLTYDFDWWGHNIYYHGWHRGPRWVVVARPWVVINPIYVSPRHTTIVINRTVVRRPVNVHNLRRYTVVHRNTNFDRRWNGYDRRDVGRNDRRDWDRRDDRRDGGRDFDRRDDRGNDRGRASTPTRRDDGRRVAPVPGNNGNSGRRVGPPSTGEADGGRRVGPPAGGADNGRRNVAQGPQRNADRRVTPLSGAPVRRAESVPVPTATSRTQGGVRATRAAAERTVDRSAGRTQAQSSNGTWNPRPSAPTAARQGQVAPRASTGTQARTAPARASVPSSGRAQAAPTRSSSPSGGRAQSAPARSSGPATSARSATQRSSGGAARSGRSQGGGGSARGSSGRGGSRPE
jgi:hypothetical protein